MIHFDGSNMYHMNIVGFFTFARSSGRFSRCY